MLTAICSALDIILGCDLAKFHLHQADAFLGVVVLIDHEFLGNFDSFVAGLYGGLQPLCAGIDILLSLGPEPHLNLPYRIVQLLRGDTRLKQFFRIFYPPQHLLLVVVDLLLEAVDGILEVALMAGLCFLQLADLLADVHIEA